MARVTKDQLERARLIPVLDYVLRYEADDYKRVGRGYRLRSDNAFAVDEKGFYCHRKCKGGVTALDYLVENKGRGLVEAVCFLLGESPQGRNGKREYNSKQENSSKQEHGSKYRHCSKGKATSSNDAVNKPVMSNSTSTISDNATTITGNAPDIADNVSPAIVDNYSQNRPPISLPLRNKDNKRIIAYLQSRGIDRDLIMDCIKRGVLYESRYYHNAVFLGKDEHGKTRFAAMRSTTTRFMRDADGSDKRYGFVIPPDNPHSKHVAVFESPIDCLSHQSLCKQGYIPSFDGWRLSLGCISLAALEHFLPRHLKVTHCIICTDNDEAGDIAAAKIADIQGIASERSVPLHGKDWNDALQAVKKAERTNARISHNARG